jgi:hypothetical protein
MKETIKEARDTEQPPSLLWETLVSTYEKLWNEDLGLDSYLPNRNQMGEKASQDLVQILGNDWKDRKTWEEKIRQFASVLESIIKQTSQQAQGQQKQSKYGQKQQGQGIPMPDDMKGQMGQPTESTQKEGKNGEKVDHKDEGKGGKGKEDEDENGDATEIDDKILEEIYKRNKEAPGSFAGTMRALKKIEPYDALRLMYRARAKELLMKIEEKRNKRAEKAPSYQTSWNIGDPLVGKGGLEMLPSIMASGKPIPGLTTVKRKLQEAEGYGRMKMIPDLLIVIDSSGSMGWHPWINPPDARGEFDKAILAAEGSAIYAIENGGRVAIINHSAHGNVTEQDFTTNINKIERAIMCNYGGGTVVPCKDLKDMLLKTQNPLLTCYMSDCDMTNVKDAFEAFSAAMNEHDSLAIFNIGSGTGEDFIRSIKQTKAVVYDIDKIEDLAGIIIGRVKFEYDSAKEGADGT